MSNRTVPSTLPLSAALALMTGLLLACTEPTTSPAPGNEGPATGAPARSSPPPPVDNGSPAPGEPPASPQPPPESPSATEPAPTNEPALATMNTAAPSNAKISVPVDLRYAIDGDVVADQAVQLHLAAVPRVAGSNLQISVQRADGLEFTEGSLSVQKASASGVYRKQVAITRRASGPSQIVVLVTMGVGQGSAFGFFSVPLDSVKQH